MIIKHATIYEANIRLKEKFEHAEFNRASNDFIFFELVDSLGHSGWGSALPRDYVTGESLDSVKKNLQRYSSAIQGSSFHSLNEISSFLNEVEPAESRNMASLCALDLALLDLYGKSTNKSVSEILYGNKRNPKSITSAPLGLNPKSWKKNLYIFGGFNDIKLKVSPESNPDKINNLLSSGLSPASLRLDGNMSFSESELEDLVSQIDFPIWYIEQPFPTKNRTHSLKDYRTMADESLVSQIDAETVCFNSANVRLGKNGGFMRSKKIVEILERRQIPYMIGSLVGETSLLSSALLHFASGLEPIVLEGAYNSKILLNDPVEKPINLKFQGNTDFNYSLPGLGSRILVPRLSEPKTIALY